MMDDTQLMVDGCTALMRLVFGESNWYRWMDIKHHTQLGNFQALLAWMLDVVERELQPAGTVEATFESDDFTNRNPSSSNVLKQDPSSEGDEVKFVASYSKEGEYSGSHHDADYDLSMPGTSDTCVQIAVDETPGNVHHAEIVLQPNSSSLFCKACNASLSNIEIVKKHISSKHSGDEIVFKCFCCPEVYTQLDQYLSCHPKARINLDGTAPELSAPNLCDFCLKSFSSAVILKSHIENIHYRTDPRYQCRDCHKFLRHQSSLSRHRKICPKRLNLDLSTY